MKDTHDSIGSARLLDRGDWRKGKPAPLASRGTRGAQWSGWRSRPPSVVLSLPERWETSNHESSHGLSFWQQGVPLIALQLYPNAGGSAGRCVHFPVAWCAGSGGARKRFRRLLIATLAGPVCDALRGDPVTPCRLPSPNNDLPTARRLLRVLEIRGLAHWNLGTLMRDAWRLLSTAKACRMRDLVARELYRRGSLSGAEVGLLCRRARRQVRRENRRAAENAAIRAAMEIEYGLSVEG